MRIPQIAVPLLLVVPLAACSAPAAARAPAADAETALGAAAAAAATSEPTPRPEATPSAEPWRFSFDPYVWLFDIDGSVSTRGRTLPVSTHLQDSVDLVQDHLDFGFAGHLEARRGDWSFFLDGNMLTFEGDRSLSGTVERTLTVGPLAVTRSALRSAEIDASLDLVLAEVGAAWKAADLGREGCDPVPVELLAGARWNRVEFDADLDVDVEAARVAFEERLSPDFETDWVDPFVGFRTRIPLTDGVALRLRGDVGGGFGSGSDRAWNAIALLEFRLSETVSAFAGWRWYDWERDSGGHESNLQMEGPGIGVAILF